MPRYEYECPEGHREEIVRPVDERDEPVTCPRLEAGECCGGSLRRVFHSPGMSIEGRAFKEYTGDINDWLASS